MLHRWLANKFEPATRRRSTLARGWLCRCVGCDSDANRAANVDCEWRLRWPRRWRRRWRLPAHTCAGHMCEGRRTVRGRVQIQLKFWPANWGGQLGGIGQCWLSCVHILWGRNGGPASGARMASGEWPMASAGQWTVGCGGGGDRRTRSHNLTFSLFLTHMCVSTLESHFTCAYVRCVNFLWGRAAGDT